MPDFLKMSADGYERMLAVRRRVHAQPEVGDDVDKTVALICAELSDCGCRVHEYGKNIVAAEIGSGAPVVLVRADIDALPERECSGLSFAANNGCAHACGHDIHVAVALAAARMLKSVEGELRGTVRILFQPDEERVRGALACIDAGVLSDVSAVFGMHTATGLKTGAVNTRSGGYLTSGDIFKIEVNGRSTHGSMPENGCDALYAAVKIVDAVQAVTTRMVDANDPVVITFGSFNSGSTHNIIPDKALLSGTIRAFSPEVREKVKKLVGGIVAGTAATYGASAEFKVIDSTPATLNDKQLCESFLANCRALLGDNMVFTDAIKYKVSDDFAYFAQRVPAVMYHIGFGSGGADGEVRLLHDPQIVFDERGMLNAATVCADAAWHYLQD